MRKVLILVLLLLYLFCLPVSFPWTILFICLSQWNLCKSSVDLGYNACNILGDMTLPCEMILIKDIVVLMLKCCGSSSGIRLFCLNICLSGLFVIFFFILSTVQKYGNNRAYERFELVYMSFGGYEGNLSVLRQN